MHTLMVLTGGFVLLFFCQLVARAVGGPGVGPMIKAMKLFIPIWFVAAAINMWIGISHAGYTVMQELPIFLVIFGVPAAAAVWTLWRLTHFSTRK